MEKKDSTNKMFYIIISKNQFKLGVLPKGTFLFKGLDWVEDFIKTFGKKYKFGKYNSEIIEISEEDLEGSYEVYKSLEVLEGNKYLHLIKEVDLNSVKYKIC